MESWQIYSAFQIGDMIARYRLDEKSGRMGLDFHPAALSDSLAHRRSTLRGVPEIDLLPGSASPEAIAIDPLVHLKIAGDPYPGAFAQGRTMRGASSNNRFRFVSQEESHAANTHVITTTLAAREGYRIEHRLRWMEGDAALQIETTFFNDSDRPVTLEMISSFSFGNITPFDAADAPGRLRVHRFRSVWSAEGRLETRWIEELHLERSWSGAGMFSERFGQVGSMPVRGWFPFVAVEDTAANVTWGAQLAWAGSWQLEVFRQHDDVCLSGGLADREFGHWMKTLAPGESLITPPATVACVQGGLDEVCDRLTSVQHGAVDAQPKVEQDLPIVFNEWCTTWGDPQHDRVVKIADRIEGSGVKYLVIDAGWYKTEHSSWAGGHGDWTPSKKLFPEGLAATAAAIRQRGLVPGLWFEMETVGEQAMAFKHIDHLLKRDGHPLASTARRFWDMNDPWAIDYLTEKAIDLLESCGFGYLKVDYNETIGIGCDHPDSQGEGLRKQILGVHQFFDRIRTRLPELVIENCSSGGHRLEASMMSRTAMSSFSDAHELREIPIIAANLHRLILPRQSQIWAVLHRADSDRRLIYSLAATFLGRMCLSGEIDSLQDSQWSLVKHALDLYPKAAPIIKHGVSRRFAETGESWRHPTGWQAVRRTSTDGKRALVVLHSFSGAPESVSIPLPDGERWQIDGQFPPGAPMPDIQRDQITATIEADDSARVILLSR